MSTKLKIWGLKAVNAGLWVILTLSSIAAVGGNPVRTMGLPGKDGKLVMVRVHDYQISGLGGLGDIGAIAIGLTVGYVGTHPLRSKRKDLEDAEKI